MALTSTKRPTMQNSKAFLQSYYSPGQLPKQIATNCTGWTISTGTTVFLLKQSMISHYANDLTYKGFTVETNTSGAPEKHFHFQLGISNKADGFVTIPKSSIEMIYIRMKTK